MKRTILLAVFVLTSHAAGRRIRAGARERAAGDARIRPRDRGETWTRVTDSDLPNPVSGTEIIALENGHWLLISNDTERGRHSLAVQISDDEGRTWKWKRNLELDAPGPEAGSYHYPSVIQARDHTLHASYSYHLGSKDVGLDTEGQPARKSIKHAHFNEAWVMEGDPAR